MVAEVTVRLRPAMREMDRAWLRQFGTDVGGGGRS